MGVYNWFADIIIPSLVGIGTLVLAAASVYVARKSHDTARESVAAAKQANEIAERQHREQLEVDARKERRTLLPKLVDWYRSASLEAALDLPAEPETDRLDDEVRRAVEAQGDLALQWFMGHAREEIINFAQDRPTNSGELRSVLSAMDFSIERLRDWANDAQSLALYEERVVTAEAYSQLAANFDPTNVSNE